MKEGEFPVEDAVHYVRDTMVQECEMAVTMAFTIRKLRNKAAPSQLASSFLFSQGPSPWSGVASMHSGWVSPFQFFL